MNRNAGTDVRASKRARTEGGSSGQLARLPRRATRQAGELLALMGPGGASSALSRQWSPSQWQEPMSATLDPELAAALGLDSPGPFSDRAGGPEQKLMDDLNAAAQ